MKKIIIALVLSLYPLFLLPPTVFAQAVCPDSANLNQRDTSDFTLVEISDSHTGGSESDYTPGNFAKVTKWIADHKNDLNIQFLFHTGDVTAGTRGIIPVADQWLEAKTAMSNIEWTIPYSITMGNRDDLSYFNQYFGPIHFANQSWYGGGFPANSNASSYYLFSASGYNFVVYSGYDLTQAKNIFQAYPNYNGIFTLHDYVNTNGTVSSTTTQNMVKGQDNIFMVLNGHMHCYPSSSASSVCRNTITNNFGHTVYQITNPSSPLTRLYLFRPTKQAICAYTYNPITNTFYSQTNSLFSLGWNLRFSPTSTGTPTPTPTLIPTVAPTLTPSPTPTSTPVVTTTPTVTPTPVITPTPTKSPSPTPTPIPTLTPSPTPIPTSTPSNTLVFSDNWESGNLSAWDTVKDGDTDLSANTMSSYSGLYGLKAILDDTTSAYIRDTLPSVQKNSVVNFYFNPNSFSAGSANIFKVDDSSSPNKIAAQVTVANTNSNYTVYAATQNDAGSWSITPSFAITNTWHNIGVEFKAATASGANNGYVKFWVDGVLKQTISGLDNDTIHVDRQSLGITAVGNGSPLGSIYFDNYTETGSAN
jgi:hypothetical protein